MRRGPGDRRPFPPQHQAAAKAIACERPRLGEHRALARLSVTDVCLRLDHQALGMSYSTVWRLLHRDAIRPWFQRQWLFPTDPRLLEKATPVLDLYHGSWQGEPLGPGDLVLCGHEMPGIPLRTKLHAPLPTAPGRDARQEFEWERHGSACYHALLNARTGRVCGSVAASSGIEPFQELLTRCLQLPEYRDVERVFLIVDNGSSHRPETSPARLQALDSRLVTVHLPKHSSWLNQAELYFSIAKRKALTPLDFRTKADLSWRLALFEGYYNAEARPFRWRYSRDDLAAYVRRLAAHEPRFAAATGPTH